MVKCPLFDNDRKDANHIYRSLRDPGNCGAERARKSCEDMWSDFSEHADPNFLDEFPVHFNQRWFEMYLTVSFIRNGYDVECSKSGPDIRIVVDGRPVWIEAVCPKPGQDDKAGTAQGSTPGVDTDYLESGQEIESDSVPELKPGVDRPVPFKQYELRIRNSLDFKQKKYRKYLEKGTVGTRDICIVAIGASGIPYFRHNIEESIAKAVYGLGDKYFSVDNVTKQYAGSGRTKRPEIRKSSGNLVDVTPFLDGSMKHISAIIGSSADTTTDLRDIGKDCVLFRNRTAANPWPGDCLPWMRECSIADSESSDIVQSP